MAKKNKDIQPKATTPNDKDLDKQNKKDIQNKNDKKNKKVKKEKKPGLFKKLKEAWSELKKVTWPTFSNVVKKTGVVILVVLIFTVVLFGIDYLLGLLYNLFMS